jgi:predicted GIY-YIG superfamily endonuclease
MAVVYGLFCEQLCLYVGSTSRKERREKEHRKGNSGCGSCKIPKDVEWDFTILEECDAKECRFRERHWYDILKPLYNQRRPRMTREELAEQDRLAAIYHTELNDRRDALNKFLQDICVDIEYKHIFNASDDTDEDE